MKIIYKYQIHLDVAAILVEMPKGAKLLHYDTQEGPENLFVWALVDTEAEMVTRTFYVRGTGHSCDTLDAPHLGTVLAGPYVWHIFGGLEL